MSISPFSVLKSDMMTESIHYRPLTTMEEFFQVAHLEAEIWGMSPEEAESPHIMQAITHNGGVILGAEAGGRLVGFTFGLPGRRGDSWLLWSHATGVLKAYQGQAIGFALKQAQRKWALEHGYRTIGWTFDPMQRGNANFNLRLLGAVVNAYILNVYGVMTDGINAGLPSDRFEAIWDLHGQRVNALAAGKPVPLLTEFPDEAFLLRQKGDALVTQPISADVQWCFAETPFDLRSLKSESIERAREWQLKFREVMITAMDQGYAVVDFETQGGRCWHILKKAT